jgi:RHS repeat-associated protein
VALPSGQLVTSTYNADNRRVSKANDDGVINFNWDSVNDNVLLETDETDTVTSEYTNVPVPFGEPLSQNRSSVLSFFHFDGNFSTRQLTDVSQSATDTVIFTGYGEEVKHTGTIVLPFGYKGAVGYYTDSDTGNIYVRARTYQPIIGRWLSMDPLGFIDGSSLYRAYFVPGKVDPSGKGVIGPFVETYAYYNFAQEVMYICLVGGFKFKPFPWCPIKFVRCHASELTAWLRAAHNGNPAAANAACARIKGCYRKYW